MAAWLSPVRRIARSPGSAWAPVWQLLNRPAAPEGDPAPPLSDTEFHAAVRTAIYDGLRPLTGWIALAYGIFLPTPFFVLPLREAAWDATFNALSMLALLALRQLIVQKRLSERHASITQITLFSLVLLRILFPSYLGPNEQISFLTLHLIASGFFCLSTPSFLVLQAATFAAWPFIGWAQQGQEWRLSSARVLLITSIIAFGFHALRRAALRRLAGHQLQDERRKAELQMAFLALREAEEQQRTILRTAPDLIATVAPDGRLLSLNRLPEGSPESVLGSSIYSYAPSEYHESMRTCLHRVLETGCMEQYEMPRLLSDGSTQWYRSRLAPLLRDGSPVAVTVVATDITEIKRIALHEKEEAQVSAGLARIGGELIASLNEPALLHRLCRLTTEVLAADVSYTFLVGDDGAFVPAAGAGDIPAEAEPLSVLKIPAVAMAPLSSQLEAHGIAQVLTVASPDLPTSALAARFGFSLTVHLPLRKRDEIVGLHCVSYRTRERPLDWHEEDLGRGIAHLASLALETARLFEALQSSNRFLADFLANMSHELRTPLNVIIGYQEMLLEGACGALNRDQMSMVEKIQRNARDLLTVMNATLELSRYQRRDLPLSMHEFDAAALLEEVAHDGLLPADKRELHLQRHVASRPMLLRTDRQKLKMILVNLIDNAIKFTERGTVAVHAAPADGGTAFRVTDTGVGIAAADLGPIFEPFRRASQSLDREVGGVGLGLNIVQRLVEALGGKIHVESELGRGSTFQVWVPEQAGGR